MSENQYSNDRLRALREEAERLESKRLGNSLVKLGRQVFAATVERLRLRGYEGIRFSYTNLLPHLDREHGSQITELADRMDVSKQAVGQMVRQLQELGYVQVRKDPSDGRARLVALTEEGFGVLLAGLEVFAEIEAELESVLGRESLDALRDGVTKARAHLESRDGSE